MILDEHSKIKVGPLTLSNDKQTLISCDHDADEVVIPKSVKEISSFAFAGCDKLMAVTIPHNVTSIGESIFMLARVRIVYIGKSVREISRCAFTDSLNLERIYVDDENKHFKAVDGILYDKAMKTLIAYPVNSPVINYVMPLTVERILIQAFEDNYNVHAIHLNRNIREIGLYTISSCMALKTLTLDPENPYLTLKKNVLYTSDMKTLIIHPRSAKRKKYHVPKSIIAMQNDAFAYNTFIEEVYFKTPIKTINYFTFRSAANLRIVVLPEGVELIEELSFLGCSSLVDVYLPLSLQNIEKDAFDLFDDEREPFNVYYPGSEETFNTNVVVANPNKDFKRATKYFNTKFPSK